MKKGAPPLRFLVLIVASWTGVRVAMLVPAWQGGTEERAVLAAATPPRPSPGRAALAPRDAQVPIPLSPGLFTRGGETRRAMISMPTARQLPFTASVGLSIASPAVGTARPRGPVAAPAALPLALGTSAPSTNRWSASAWLLVRDEIGGDVLAPGGTLGGSQAGARLLYRLNDNAAQPLALAARVYTPLRRTGGAEAAIGLDWRPIARIPVNMLIERREALGDDGRSAFALTLYGGASANLPGRFRLDSYAQAGVVGARSRDLFVDGAVRIARAVGPVEIGAGAWGAAQPGASRLDAGPQVSWRLPVRRANIRLSADWRFRIAGDAEPGSGPALTLGADF